MAQRRLKCCAGDSSSADGQPGLELIALGQLRANKSINSVATAWPAARDLELNGHQHSRYPSPSRENVAMSEDRTKASLRKGGKRKGGRPALNPKQISGPIRQDGGGLPPGAPPMPKQADGRRRAPPPGGGKVSCRSRASRHPTPLA